MTWKSSRYEVLSTEFMKRSQNRLSSSNSNCKIIIFIGNGVRFWAVSKMLIGLSLFASLVRFFFLYLFFLISPPLVWYLRRSIRYTRRRYKLWIFLAKNRNNLNSTHRKRIHCLRVYICLFTVTTLFTKSDDCYSESFHFDFLSLFCGYSSQNLRSLTLFTPSFRIASSVHRFQHVNVCAISMHIHTFKNILDGKLLINHWRNLTV